MKKLTAVFFSVVLVGSGSVPTYAQSKGQKFGGPGAFGPGGVDGRSVEPLRREVVKLSEELETAVKSIKRLQMVQVGAEADAGPRYQGWTARTWLRQFEDLDASYRLEAIKALGVLATRNKDLIPVLLASLKDESDDVGNAGAYALAALGANVTPALVNVLKDKTSVTAQIHAAYALSKMDPRPKTAVPALAEALKVNNWTLREAAVNALGGIGPDAKSALPAMIETFQEFLKKKKSGNPRPRDKFLPAGTRRKGGGGGASEDEMAEVAILRSMLKIDPKATVPVLTLALKEHERVYLVDSAIRMIADIGPDAKAVLPIMVGVFENSLKDLKGEFKNAQNIDFGNTRPFLVLRAVVKIDPECRSLFPRTVREVVPPNTSLDYYDSREQSVTLEDLEEVLVVLKKRNV